MLVSDAMPSSRLGAVALIAAGALWAQLVLLPTMAVSGRDAVDLLAVGIGILALAVPVAGVIAAEKRPRLATAAVVAGFPIALGLFGLASLRQPRTRFDAPARLIASATAVAFAIAAIAWARSLTPTFPVTIAPMEPVTKRAPAPRLQREAFWLVTAMAAFLAVVAPVIVTSRPALTRVERVGGEPLVRARDAIVSAGGLALALLVILGAGTSLLRRSRSTRTTNGMTFLLFGIAMFGLEWLVRTQR